MVVGQVDWMFGVVMLFSQCVCVLFDCCLQCCGVCLICDFGLCSDEVILVCVLFDVCCYFVVFYQFVILVMLFELLCVYLCVELECIVVDMQCGLEEGV